MSAPPRTTASLSIALAAALAGWHASACKSEAPGPSSGELEAFSYLASVESRGIPAGVRRWDEERAFTGLNLMVGADGHSAVLLDMRGEVVHSFEAGPAVSALHHVHLREDGRLLAIFGPWFANGYDRRRWPRTAGMVELGWSGDERWYLGGVFGDGKPGIGFSHEIAISETGEIFSIDDEPMAYEHGGETIELRRDYLMVVSPGGELVRKISVAELAEPFYDREWLAKVAASASAPYRLADITHLNAMSFIPRDIPGVAERGDWLISLRNHDVIVIVSPRTRRAKWAWGPGEIVRQHQPTVLENGHFLIFDNQGHHGASRVIELEPRSRRIVWQYAGEPPEAFHSETRGSAQRLPNGNTLILESDRGRAFEVTPDGEIVWEYFTPVREHDPRLRAAPYRIRRLAPEEIAKLPWSGAQRARLARRGYLP